MIISRTPFRISFFGGGTDYPEWYMENGGSVLSTTINKYCYVSCRHLPPFFKHRFRIVYSNVENCNTVSEIRHPAVKASLEYLKMNHGLEIHHDGDLPACTGLGSSSAFTVALLNALHALRQKMPTKKQLSLEAIEIERKILKESGGVQDQIAVAYGGLNRITFNGEFAVQPVILNKYRLKEFKSHMMLYFTGLSRLSGEISKKQAANIPNKKNELSRMSAMVNESLKILTGGDIELFGKLLDETWQIKRTLSDSITNQRIDDIYKASLEAGALGGKLLGAGGGGFILLFARPSDQPRIREKLKDLLLVPFEFDNLGAQIIFYDREA